jgi:hypothetical protein
MVIDLTRRPVYVNTDICTGQIVVRTAAGLEVDGRIGRKLGKSYRFKGEQEGGKSLSLVTVGAQTEIRAPNGARLITMEYRLPVQEIVQAIRSGKVSLEPYEVSTVYADAITGLGSTWRAQIIVGYRENKQGIIWLVTVRDETAKVDLLTATCKEATTKGLTMRGDPESLLPLERLSSPTPALAILSVWDRIRLISYEP